MDRDRREEVFRSFGAGGGAAGRPSPDGGFELWARDNPRVLALFERFALEAVRAGLSHYSADAVLHRVRWETAVAERSGEFKANNNWTSYLARWFAMRHPEHAAFFRTRSSRADRDPALGG